MIEYTIIRSKRKTLAIHITKNAEVEVRAPFGLPASVILDFVSTKEGWVTAHLREMMLKVEQAEAFSLSDGDELSLLGRVVPLVFCEDQGAFFDGSCFYIEASDDPLKIKTQVIELYRRLARKILTHKVVTFAEIMGVHPTGVKINGADTRWGSCSGKNSLNFSWKLIMASEDAVDYVVVHELAHIREHNHSAHFWKIVAKQIPDFEKKKEKLKRTAQKLRTENWD